MNNDIKPISTPSSASLTGQPPQPVSDNTPPAATPPPQDSFFSKLLGKIRRFFGFLLLLLLVVLVAGGLYYWQQARVKNLEASRKSLEGEITMLKTQIKTAQSTAAATTDKTPVKIDNPQTTIIQGDVVTGDYTYDTVGKGHGAAVYFLPGVPTEVWIEYGEKATDLNKSTAKVKSTAQGTPGEYLKQDLTLEKVASNTLYFWRAAGTVDGKTVYGGIASFYAQK